jgi:hypothetical protein
MNRFRQRRYRTFFTLLDVTPNTRILDVGGQPDEWIELGFRGQVTCVCLSRCYAEGAHGKGNIHYVRHDACALPYGDLSFDVIYSNSLIEHVGAANQATVAREMRRVGRRYWVQVPCRSFFWEPHYQFPCFWILPAAMRRWVCRGWSARFMSGRHYVSEVDSMHLLDSGEMRRLFPDGRVLKERFLGMTKSLIAYRT